MKFLSLFFVLVLPLIASAAAPIAPSFVDMGAEISAIFNDSEITERVLGTVSSVEYVRELPGRTSEYRVTTTESRPVKDPNGTIIQYADQSCIILVDVTYAGYNGPKITGRDFSGCPADSIP